MLNRYAHSFNAAAKYNQEMYFLFLFFFFLFHSIISLCSFSAVAIVTRLYHACAAGTV